MKCNLVNTQQGDEQDVNKDGDGYQPNTLVSKFCELFCHVYKSRSRQPKLDLNHYTTVLLNL